jgi:uncharacterized small protein (DUF1192 family)
VTVDNGAERSTELKRWSPTMRESAHGDWVDLEDALEAIEARDQRIAALEAEVARLRGKVEVLEADAEAVLDLTMHDDSEDSNCACCGTLIVWQAPLCEECAPTFTTYADGMSCCQKHERGES